MAMKESYVTVDGEYEEVTVIEKSKFITHVKHVSSEEEARSFIERINKKYYDATHNCYAYIADKEGTVFRFSDDGEPQGTAGIPMLEAIKNGGVSEVTVAVTRYFGGIKLGAGGLVRAYSGCTASALKNAKKKELFLSSFYTLSCGYEYYKSVLKLFSGAKDYYIKSQDFSDGVKVEFAVKISAEKTFKEKITETFSGRLVPEKTGEGYGEYK